MSDYGCVYQVPRGSAPVRTYILLTCLNHRSGLKFTSLRAALYADAFPLFLNWYPTSERVLLPKIQPPVTESRIAFASRAELGEAIATLLSKGLSAFPEPVQPKTDKNIILLTGSKVESLVDLVDAINDVRDTRIPLEFLESQTWIEACAKDDIGGKSKSWFEARLVFTQGVTDGDAETITPALEILLGRKPEYGTQSVKQLVGTNPEYTWHQNHAN